MKAVALVVTAVLAQALLAGDVPAGNRAFREGDFREAARRYQRALERGDSSALVRYNLGTALLRLGRSDEARAHLEAAGRGENRRLRGWAHYNAGNADLGPVAAGRVDDDAERRERLERAITRYRRALLADPADARARWNLELAQRLLRQDTPPPRDDPEQGGGGRGGPERPQPSAPQPRPDASPSPGERPMSRAEAERILSAAEQAERQVQREVMRRNQGQPRVVRDW